MQNLSSGAGAGARSAPRHSLFGTAIGKNASLLATRTFLNFKVAASIHRNPPHREHDFHLAAFSVPCCALQKLTDDCLVLESIHATLSKWFGVCWVWLSENENRLGNSWEQGASHYGIAWACFRGSTHAATFPYHHIKALLSAARVYLFSCNNT
jgi:hypothetical protein